MQSTAASRPIAWSESRSAAKPARKPVKLPQRRAGLQRDDGDHDRQQVGGPEREVEAGEQRPLQQQHDQQQHDDAQVASGVHGPDVTEQSWENRPVAGRPAPWRACAASTARGQRQGHRRLTPSRPERPLGLVGRAAVLGPVPAGGAGEVGRRGGRRHGTRRQQPVSRVGLRATCTTTPTRSSDPKFAKGCDLCAPGQALAALDLLGDRADGHTAGVVGAAVGDDAGTRLRAAASGRTA